MKQSVQRRFIAKALDVWAPDWPRRVGRYQQWANTKRQAVEMVLDAQEQEDNSPFVSTFSFPRGHSSEGEIPRINTIFIDFDFERGDYQGNGNYDAWRRDLSHLLVRVRRVADLLDERGRPGWRASLSGHKGVHLFLDVPTISTELGDLAKYKAGMESYTSGLIEFMRTESGIDTLDDYVDVTSSDMGRLFRCPNTLHGGATDSLDTPRFCVPVTISELASMTVDNYESLTAAPRMPAQSERQPNERAGEVLQRHIETATRSSHYSSGTSTVDRSRIDKYKREANHSIDVDDLDFVLTHKPCLNNFRKREDKWSHLDQSHIAETAYLVELINQQVPIDVIKASLSSTDGYDPEYTDDRIKELISRDYNPYNLETLRDRIPKFCD